MNYKLVIPPMTIHFCEDYPMRKKPVMAVSFDGENCQYKVASFNDEKTMRWFIECFDDALKQANVKKVPGRGGRDVTDNEIFARIASDVADVGNSMFGVRDITIWMTKDLFNRLLPEQYIIHNDNAMITLFGCKVKVVLFPCDGMQWIVGYEGKAEEGE